ncbi:MAG TPA: FtsX-like permease family protein [Bacteroidales bacterium]|nr:FtsX-like permease family protein [Bacteroidales bacterium]HPR11451.1 FtsX-like permease family protein [Bacteroidales bacterium]HRW86124.1 FtsX-like permease family protein [Bacteroidales bacterium]
MLSFKLALRNLLGAGLRTWLNVVVLSFSFIIIIWTKGMLEGWDRQAKSDMIKWEIAGGQLWHINYDPYDPLSLDDSHGKTPPGLTFSSSQPAVPVLITQGTIYPEGRMLSVLVKGIPPDQKLLALPTDKLVNPDEEVPAIIGKTMAENAKLDTGDYVTLRWRDKNGTFDAKELKITAIFDTNVPTVDVGQIWIPIDDLQSMMLLPGEATLIVTPENTGPIETNDEWTFRDHKFLLADIESIIRAKGSVGMIVWLILLMMAMLAVFDTQVLSIFRRQKEIGTCVALGMTRGQVVKLFTMEGAMHSVLAAIVGAIYGIPLLLLQAKKGINIPLESSDFGLAMAEKLYPVYSAALIAVTVLIVMTVTTIVSYWPSRKIAKLNPTEALRGRIQ